MNFSSSDAPLLIVMGQSNAHGHGTRLPVEEQINLPLSNVYGLSREPNQSYGLNEIVWSGFVTHGMNLGETQDHTCCLAESFARRWQQRTDSGQKLPPLYIVQISIGAQGIAEQEGNGCNMWYPRRAPVMVPGPLGFINISLFPLAIEILALVMKNLLKAKTPKILGLHWNQWETEVETGGRALEEAEQNYRFLFDSFESALGTPYPLYLYRPLSRAYQNPEGLKQMDALFQRFAGTCPQTKLIDLSQSTLYVPSRPDQGIFLEDLVHYSPAAQRWFAKVQERDIFNEREDL